MSGDFNHKTPTTILPTFNQFVECKTEENRTLDLLFANAKEAYSSIALPPLGISDYKLVSLEPHYAPAVLRQPVITRTV